MNPTIDVWTDPELHELVRNEPELAAIADALVQAGADTSASRRRPTRTLRLLAAAAVIVTAVTVALIAPWHRSAGTLADEALAALGTQPVLHVVAETPTGAQLVDIGTGATRPVVQQEEIWYDADQGLKRDTTRVGQTIVNDTLETPQGGYTPGGIVYDCAWIAAHPVEATKARVSCNASGDNGTTPRTIPRPKPALDPGLAGFVDGYTQALASGQAKDGGAGTLDGRPVDWLIFQTNSGEERVALDQTTHKPVLLQADNGPSLKIDTIETIPYDTTDFARPSANEIPPQPSYGRAGDGPSVDLDGSAVAVAMPGAVWAGPSVEGLPLARAEQQTLTASFVHHVHPTVTGAGIQLDYGTMKSPGRLDRSRPFVQINEAPSATLAYGNMWGFIHGTDPSEGELYLATPASSDWQVGFTVLNGSYVTIQASSRDLVLRTARALVLAKP
jgi:hypothetical protein